MSLVFALIVAYIWYLHYRLPLAWIAIVVLLAMSHYLRRETPRELGFRQEHWRDSLRTIGIPLAGLVVALAALGIFDDSFRRVSAGYAVEGFAVYLLWGLVQQYLLNGFIVNRLRQAIPRMSAHRSSLYGAVLFAAVHAPNWFLMLVTFFGGYFCARVYLRDRNLYVLGVAHGMAGYLLYMVVPDAISHHLYVGPRWFAWTPE